MKEYIINGGLGKLRH